MLSRLATQSLLRCLRQFQIPAAYSSTNVPQSGTSQRDLVNYPRPVRLDTEPPTVFNLIPKSWFDFMYPKTGVTGPYMLMTGFGTYLLSKEIFVINSETVMGFAYVLLLVLIHKLYGNQIKAYIHKQQDENDKLMDSVQEKGKDDIREAIAEREKALWQTEGTVQYLADAKRECVYLQMEAAYRARLEQAFLKVKKCLDYQIEKQNVERRIVQRNMVDYIIKNVEQSITPQLKKNTLKQCIGDLKALASKA